MAEKPSSRFWKAFDISIIILSGLSGPFVLLLLPIIFIKWYLKKTTWNKKILIITVILAGIQFGSLLLSRGGGRLNLPTEVSLNLLAEIFSKQIIWGSLVGKDGYLWIIEKVPFYSIFFQGSMVLGFIILIYAAIKAPTELKLFMLFAFLIFLVSILIPTTTATKDHSTWLILSEAFNIRYWLIPMVAFLATATWSTTKKNPMLIRCIGYFFLTWMFLFSIKHYRHLHNYQYPAYPNLHYKEYIKEFEKAPKGTTFVIPINPPGWSMKLIKK